MNPLTATAWILFLGVMSQWVAHRLRVPSILVLLVAGFVVGPATGLLDPDALLGDLLLPFVSISVGILLFEGGLGLRIQEMKGHAKVVVRLITIGAIATGAVGTFGAYFLLDLPLQLAILLGSVLVVSGPTVVLPLLRHIQPTRKVESILRWEGILIDPVGAVMAVLLFEAFLHGQGAEGIGEAIGGIALAFVAGAAVGIVLAGTWVAMEKRFWIPDRLHSAFGLGLVVAGFALSEAIVPESGLVATTAMGMALANQKLVPIRHLLTFKEDLSHILLGSLFIILAARLQPSQIAALDASAFLFVALLILVARPLAVAISSLSTSLSWRERVFLGFMAPRGIVAAAVAAFFALQLEASGNDQAAIFVPVTFLVIVGTVLVYGTLAKPLAKVLGVAGPPPEGVLFVGANIVSRKLAKLLQEEDFRVLMIDDDAVALSAAGMDDIQVHRTSLLAMEFMDEVELSGIGRLWAITPSAEVNSLAAVRFSEAFESAKVCQIALHGDDAEGEERHLRGRTLFAADLTYRLFRERLQKGWTLRRTPITEQFTRADWQAKHPKALPLFVIHDGKLSTFTAEYKPHVDAGSTLVSLTPPEDVVVDVRPAPVTARGPADVPILPAA